MGWPQTVHDVPLVLHAVASCALGTASNILKSQLQTIENQRVPLNSVEAEFSQMPNLLCALTPVPYEGSISKFIYDSNPLFFY